MRKRKFGRFFGGVAAFAMVISVMSTTVLAADYTLYLGDMGWVHKDSFEGEVITNSSDYEGSLNYDYENNTWTMEDFKFSTSAGTAVEVHYTLQTLIVKGNNEITSTADGKKSDESRGIYSGGSLTIKGEGESPELIVTGGVGNGSGGASYGIYTTGNLTISDVNIQATGGKNKNGSSTTGSNGIYASAVTIKNGSKVAATGGSSASSSYGISSGTGQVRIEGDSTVIATGGTADKNSVGIAPGLTALTQGTLVVDGDNTVVVAKGGEAKVGSYGIKTDLNTAAEARIPEITIPNSFSAKTGSDSSSAKTVEWTYFYNSSLTVEKYVKIAPPSELGKPDPVYPPKGGEPDDGDPDDGAPDDGDSDDGDNPGTDNPPAPSAHTPAAPTQNATIAGLTGDTNTVLVSTNNGVASVSTISMDMIEQIASSTTNGTDIVLDVSSVGDVKNVTLTKETMSNIAQALNSADNNKESLVVKTKAASLELDKAALNAVVNQAKADRIQLVVENKENANLNEIQQAAVKTIASEAGKEVVSTFEAYIASGNSKITDLNGGRITVGKLDLTVPDGKNPTKYTVYAISETGSLTPCDTWVENGSIMFNTVKLSNYVLVYDANL